MHSNMSIDPRDFYRVCRICLSKEATQSIFALEHNGVSTLTFFYCTFIHVDKDDGLPQNLCWFCYQEVIRIHNFQEKCRQNQILLKFFLTKPDPIIIRRERNWLEFATNYYDSASEANKTITKTPADSSTLSSSFNLSKYEFASSDGLENDNTMGANYSDKICRTCLSIEKVQPIFGLKYKGMSIVNLLDSYSVHVERNDGLPQSFCSVCLQNIIKMDNFQEMCKQNERLLRYALTEPELAKQTIAYKILNKREENELQSSTNPCDISGENSKKKVNKFFCPYCNKCFANKTLHLKVHTKETPHACNVCKKSFARRYNLKEHERLHTGDRPYYI